jgi:hypothetical protein
MQIDSGGQLIGVLIQIRTKLIAQAQVRLGNKATGFSSFLANSTDRQIEMEDGKII